MFIIILMEYLARPPKPIIMIKIFYSIQHNLFDASETVIATLINRTE